MEGDAGHPTPEGQLGQAEDPFAITYGERYVAFVDILGFADLVRQADLDQDRLAAIVDALRTVSRVASPTHADTDLRAQNFSDSLILSAEATADGFWHLLLTLDRLAWNLLSIGVLVRGAVARGRVHHDDQIVFGVGVNEAYRLESTIARVPRIIVSRAVMEDARAYAVSGPAYFERLVRDEDGIWFINFLNDLSVFAFEHPSVDIARGSSWYSASEIIREQLQKQLDELIDRPEAYSKLVWMARFWNVQLTDDEAGRISPIRKLYPASEADPSRPLRRRARPLSGEPRAEGPVKT